MTLTVFCEKEQRQSNVEYSKIILSSVLNSDFMPSSYYYRGKKDISFAPKEEEYQEKREENSVYFVTEIYIEILSQYYVIENIDEFREFLMFHNQIIDVLLDAPKWIKKIFGESIKIDLRVHFDPEEDYEELFVVLKTSLKPEEALSRLDVLDDEWFINVVDKTGGFLNVTEEVI